MIRPYFASTVYFAKRWNNLPARIEAEAKRMGVKQSECICRTLDASLPPIATPALPQAQPGASDGNPTLGV